MNISKINNYNATPNFKGINAQKILSKASGLTSWQERLVLGVTAMAIQPMIDLKNKQVDEDTRKVSANRSLAKGFVSMATGIIMRGGCMKLVELSLQKDKAVNLLAKATAENTTKEAVEKAKDYIKNQGGAKQYAHVIGTIAALGIMLFTNFLIDAPVTNWLTNLMNKKYNNKQDNKDVLTNSNSNATPITPKPSLQGGAK